MAEEEPMAQITLAGSAGAAKGTGREGGGKWKEVGEER